MPEEPRQRYALVDLDIGNVVGIREASDELAFDKAVLTTPSGHQVVLYTDIFLRYESGRARSCQRSRRRCVPFSQSDVERSLASSVPLRRVFLRLFVFFIFVFLLCFLCMTSDSLPAFGYFVCRDLY